MEIARMNLQRSFFGESEKTLLQSGGLTASAFAFPGGVCGLRVKNARGELVMLPFQGQQIWSARFCGRDLAMRSSVLRPAPTTDFLRTYGGFLLHCGATAMGVPSASDGHPLHGELPNMPYGEAHIAIGEDEKGRYIAVGGRAQHTVAFGTNYAAEPEVRLHEDATVADVTMTISNLRSQPMECMYLCHINFRPFEGSRLVYSAPADGEHVKVHFVIPPGMDPAAASALEGYMKRVAEDPSVHDSVDSGTQVYNPEIVMTIRYLADGEGYAHAMQVLPDGGACYVAFRPEELPYGLRWIARTGDEDALGLVLPATAEHLGLNHARRNGQIKMLDAHEKMTVHMKVGYLEGRDAAAVHSRIDSILGG